MTARPRRAVATAAGAALLVFATWLLCGFGGPAMTLAVSEWGAIGGSVFALGCALWAAHDARGRQRRSWACLAFGLSGWVVGNVLWATVDLAVQQGSRPITLADYCFFLLPVGAFMAAVFVPTGSGGGRLGVRSLLDGVIVATSLFTVAWVVVLRELYDTWQVPTASFVTFIAFPMVDLVMVTVGVLLILKARKGFRLTPTFITGGLIAIGLSDANFLYLSVHGHDASYLVVIGWTLGMYLIGLAGLSSREVPPPGLDATRSPSRASVWLPYLPMPFAIAVGSHELWPSPTASPVLVAGLVMIIAALVRQFLLLAENRRLLATVKEIALRDPLTGLPNRALFNDRLSHAMLLRERNGGPIAVLLADLDDFKLVNDSLGHPVGDEVLRCVGERIQNGVRAADTVARLGGDEFAILVEDAPVIAEQIAERIVAAFDEPFTMSGRAVYMRLSIGLATAVGDSDVSADELFERADLAMYSAKRAHVGARIFTPAMRLDATELNLPSRQQKTGNPSGVARIQFLGDLRRAIDQRELDLVYQPKVSLTTNEAVGVEGLIRWPHPEFGVLEPADFLPLVRENGLMEAVTELVLERAVDDAAGWRRAGIDLPVAINLSAPSLNDEALPHRVLAALAARGLAPTSLTVEITEDLLLASVVRARTILDRLREAGIRVAIDDFGTGYAAMTYLHELPIDELKLDRQFIAPILHDERAAAIVRSVIELAHEFGLVVIAEGVENRETAELLKSYDCGFAQGHYFSVPVPARAIRLGAWSVPGDGGVTPIEAVRPSLA